MRRVRALESVIEVSQKSSKAFMLKVADLAFTNEDLKAQVHNLKAQVTELSSVNKGLEAEARKARDELKLKVDNLL